MPYTNYCLKKSHSNLVSGLWSGAMPAPQILVLVSHAMPCQGGTASQPFSLPSLLSWCCAHRCGGAGWGHELSQEAGHSWLWLGCSFGDWTFVCLFALRQGFSGWPRLWKQPVSWSFLCCYCCRHRHRLVRQGSMMLENSHSGVWIICFLAMPPQQSLNTFGVLVSLCVK